jgi:putative ABC transport system permease protein
MISFLIKGILRDRSKSLIPIVIISIGVTLTVLTTGYVTGALSDIVDQNAKLDTGHLKVMTKPYAENKDQIPNDLALLGLEELTASLQTQFPDVLWTPRIRFGGIIDVPDQNGDTKSQGPGMGLAVNLLNPNSGEGARLNLDKALVRGRLPENPGEVVLSEFFAQKLKVDLGEELTFFGSSMEGSMVFYQFVLTGTVQFGMPAMDKGAFVIDISDAQRVLDMQNGSGELLGYLPYEIYNDTRASEIATAFNAQYENSEDEYAPVMLTLKQQNNLGSTLDYSQTVVSLFIFIFVFAMSIVLWNTGLIGGLRRYKEFGIRLALGESKGKVYRLLLTEASIIGLIGSLIGTTLGLAGTYYLQIVGIDISKYIENSTMIMPSVIRARVSANLFFIGFIPGLLSMLFGTMLSGRAIFKRDTARLFNELEV